MSRGFSSHSALRRSVDLRQRLAELATSGVTGRYRLVAEATVDVCAWMGALNFATLLRYDFEVGHLHWLRLLALGASAGIVQVGVGLAFGLYVGRSPTASFEEAKALGGAVAVTTAAVFLGDLFLGTPVPRSAVIGGGLAALLLIAASRFCYRSLIEVSPRGSDASQRLLVFGAGEGGCLTVRALLRDPASTHRPVALLDDDPHKRHRRILGVRVVGTRMQLVDAARQFKADAVLIAIPSADASLIAELTALASQTGLPVKRVPSVTQLLDAGVDIADIRDVSEEDLLGRHGVETDVDAIAGYITGRRVLVTGAGGSIGSELCRQLWRYAPAELIMLDRDESALHGVQMSLEGRALLDSPDLVLMDIRDRLGLERLFAARRPQVVFHAAALKHLPLLERYPGEAVKTNVWGTLALLEAAAAKGVERFVNISTDKAAAPISVLGYSKRVCERLTAHFAAATANPFLSVRFGNVLGSRGSVLGAFEAQVKNGGPVTVTDPGVTRYFMTIEESVQLVIQAGAIGGAGEALVLDMGKPVRIVDIARLLLANAPQQTKIVYTGLRPGEKLHETALADDEVDERPHHPLITQVPVPGLEPSLVQKLDPLDPAEVTTRLLRELSLYEDPNAKVMDRGALHGLKA